MELRRLRYFVVLATELHFGRAAAHLRIAQPALSQQIKVLEREVGGPLFVRSPRRVDLTPAGRALLGHAVDILERAEHAAEDVRLVARGMTGRLRVAFTRSAPGGAARAIVAEFRTSHPDVQLTTSVGHSARNAADLTGGDVDAAFVYPPLDQPDLQVVPISTEPLGLAVPADHALARVDAVRPADVRDERVVSWPRTNGPGLHDAIQRQVWGDRPPRVEREEPDEDHMLRAVADGAGVAVCLASKIETLRVPGVAVRRFADPAPTVVLGLAWRADDEAIALKHLLDIARTLREPRT